MKKLALLACLLLGMRPVTSQRDWSTAVITSLLGFVLCGFFQRLSNSFFKELAAPMCPHTRRIFKRTTYDYFLELMFFRRSSHSTHRILYSVFTQKISALKTFQIRLQHEKLFTTKKKLTERQSLWHFFLSLTLVRP